VYSASTQSFAGSMKSQRTNGRQPGTVGRAARASGASVEQRLGRRSRSCQVGGDQSAGDLRQDVPATTPGAVGEAREERSRRSGDSTSPVGEGGSSGCWAARGREDDHDQDADHAADPDLGHGAGARPRRRQGRARGAQADRLRLRRRARPLRAPVRARQPALLRRALRRRPGEQKRADRRAARARRARGPREGARRGLLRGMRSGSTSRAAAPRPDGRLPRRADDRRRPGRRARAAADDRSLVERARPCC
jgi:hypothetical protein